MLAKMSFQFLFAIFKLSTTKRWQVNKITCPQLLNETIKTHNNIIIATSSSWQKLMKTLFTINIMKNTIATVYHIYISQLNIITMLSNTVC